MKKKFIYCAFVCIIICCKSNAQNIQWQNTIGGNSNDETFSIVQTANHGFICGGRSQSIISGDKTESTQGGYDSWVVKLDSVGNIQWQNNFGGTFIDQLDGIAVTADGGYICCVSSSSNMSVDKSENSMGAQDYWIVKLDSAGAIEWENTIGGNATDQPWMIQQTPDGGYICGGESWSGISGDKSEPVMGTIDYWVLKLDSSGNIVWQNTIGGAADDRLRAIALTTDGGYICGGYSNSNISGDKTENSLGVSDYWIVKLNSSGNIEWQNTIGGNSFESCTSIAPTTDGGYICGGYSESGISGDKTENTQGYEDYWVIKLDSAGNIQWQNTIGGSIVDELFSVVQAADGGYYCGGVSSSNASGDKSENCMGSSDYWLIKLDSAGNIQWENTLGGNLNEQLYSVATTFDGGVICGGWSDSNISGDKTENSQGSRDYWILKIGDSPVSAGSIQQVSSFGYYPNPFASEISVRIQGQNFRYATIIITDIMGQTLLTCKKNFPVSDFTKTFDLAFLSKGIYLLEVTIDGERTVKKIVKQ